MEQESKFDMTDSEAMVRLINTTMMPQLFELKAMLAELAGSFKHYIELQEVRSSDATMKINSLESRIIILETVVSGAKDSDDTGLKGRVGQLQDWMKARIWFERLIIGAVVVQIIGLLFLLAQNYVVH